MKTMLLSGILIDGGYIENNQYHFYSKDHLGNNRTVVAANGVVSQQNHYYPFGASFADGFNKDKDAYKYNGKEQDRMHGLDWYDYAARHATFDLPRFTTVDPHAESYFSWSPYAYCANNPIKIIDPTGMDWYKSKDGTCVMWRDSNDESYTHTIEGPEGSISLEMENIGSTHMQYLPGGCLAIWDQNDLSGFYELDSYDQKNLSFTEKWGGSENILSQISYSLINDVYVTAQGTVHLLSLGTLCRNRTNELTGGAEYENLDGTTNYNAEMSLVNVASSSFAPMAKGASGSATVAKGMSIKTMDTISFSKTFKGSLSKLSPKTRGRINGVINGGIKVFNSYLEKGTPIKQGAGLFANDKNK